MKLASLTLIQGLSVGLEFVDKAVDDGIPHSMIVFDFFILRFIFQVGE